MLLRCFVQDAAVKKLQTPELRLLKSIKNDGKDEYAPLARSSSALAVQLPQGAVSHTAVVVSQALSSPVWSDGEGEGGGGPQPCARRTRHSRRMTCRPHPGRDILAGVGADERRAPDQ